MRRIRDRAGFLEAGERVEGMARWGHVAKGLVYCVVGLLALRTAGQLFEGRGSSAPDEHIALEEIGKQAFGSAMLGATAVGLLFYALWRFYQVVRNPDRREWPIRIGRMASSGIHVMLAVGAVHLLLEGRDTSTSETAWTAWLMSFPFGRWLVGGLGLAVIVVGLAQFRRAWTDRFLKSFHLVELPASRRTLLLRAGRAGHVARGLVFLMIGGFLIQAAITIDASQSGGMAEALEELMSRPFGWLWLALAGVGMLAYGVYAFLLARHGRFVTR